MSTDALRKARMMEQRKKMETRFRELHGFDKLSPEIATEIATEIAPEIAPAPESTTDAIMRLVDKLGTEGTKDVDPRAWGHLIGYIPKDLTSTVKGALLEEYTDLYEELRDVIDNGNGNMTHEDAVNEATYLINLATAMQKPQCKACEGTGIVFEGGEEFLCLSCSEVEDVVLTGEQIKRMNKFAKRFPRDTRFEIITTNTNGIGEIMTLAVEGCDAADSFHAFDITDNSNW